MTLRLRFPLTFAVGATLLGAVALLAVFFAGFRDSIDREHDAYYQLAQQDSLLQLSYRTTWDAYHLGRRAYLVSENLQPRREEFAALMRQLSVSCQEFRASLSADPHLDSMGAPLFASIDSVRQGLTDYFDTRLSSQERSILGRRLFESDLAVSMAGLRGSSELVHQAIVTENISRLASIDSEIEEKYSTWAFVAFGFVLVGVILTPVIRRLEARKEEQHRRLAAGEEQFRAIVENAQDGIVIMQGVQPLYANPVALSLFGCASLEEMQKGDLLSLLGPSARSVLVERVTGKVPGEEVARHEELRSMTWHGRLVDLEVNARIISWNEVPSVHVTFRDITNRKMQEREQALLLWEQESLSRIDSRLVGVIDLGRILDEILAQVVSLTKAPWAGVLMREGQSERLRWRSMKGAVAPMPSEPVRMSPTLRAVLTGSEPFVTQEVGPFRDDRLSAAAGLSEERLVTSAWIPLKGEVEASGVVVVGYRQPHEFTSRELLLLHSMAEKTSIAASNASLYEDLLAREHELEILSGARVNAQEEERRRIAREIHDGLGQILTAVKFNIEILEDSSSLGDDDRRRIGDMKTLLDNVMKEAREISYNLMPSVLDDFGLAPALQLLAERFGIQTGIQVTFVAQGMTQRLPGAMEIALYRIVQEALNNAVRHGEATVIAIQAFRGEEWIRLTIEDNGKGMQQDDAVIRRMVGSGIGIASMRERVNSFRGEFLLESAPGHGTLITVEVPLREREGPHV